MTPRPRIAEGRVCGAKKRQSEGTCVRPAGWGTDHPGWGNCRSHAGTTPNGRMKALKQQMAAEVARRMGPVVLMPRADEATVRAVGLAVIDGLDLDLDEMVAAREALEDAIADLKRTAAAQAKRIEQDDRRAMRAAASRKRRATATADPQPDDSSALAPSPDEEAALDALVRPTVLRRKRKGKKK